MSRVFKFILYGALLFIAVLTCFIAYYSRDIVLTVKACGMLFLMVFCNPVSLLVFVGWSATRESAMCPIERHYDFGLVYAPDPSSHAFLHAIHTCDLEDICEEAHRVFNYEYYEMLKEKYPSAGKTILETRDPYIIIWLGHRAMHKRDRKRGYRDQSMYRVKLSEIKDELARRKD